MILEDPVDYIFSSHCLEHIGSWVDALEYWLLKLKIGGVLFLYLPHYSQEYWRPWNNRKHFHCLDARILRDWMAANGFGKIFYSGRDLNNSFILMGEKL